MSAPKEPQSEPMAINRRFVLRFAIPLLLATVTFLVYWPSLKSGLVYDAREEILREGFITSPANLPAVLSLKVLGMNLMLGSRPGQMLYMMLIAVFSGKDSFGYHLCSNLLHAVNVAFLFVLLRRLIASEFPGFSKREALMAQFAAAIVSLIFALHPIAVESVSEVSYSSSLLVTFFTLLTLLAAVFFRPDIIWIGVAGTLCAFAAVASKESGLTATLILIVYWLLFRRREAKKPWLLFLGAAASATALFLAARFYFAPHNPTPPSYLGGAFYEVFFIQPRLWVFMMGKLVWPVTLSADYTPGSSNGVSLPIALFILAGVVLLQDWLASRSRIGALGVAIYWLGLITVSNFVPLYSALADRYYYLPLTGLAMQLLALLLLTLKSRSRFWIAATPFVAVILPLTILTVTRQAVFSNEFSFWSDTVRSSPSSWVAHNGLGVYLDSQGQYEEAAIQYQEALKIAPIFSKAHNNLGVTLVQRGRLAESLLEFQNAVLIEPGYDDAQFNIGNALLQMGRYDEAITQLRKTLEHNPNYARAHKDLGSALMKKGKVAEAITEYEEAARFDPDDMEVQEALDQARETAPQAVISR